MDPMDPMDLEMTSLFLFVAPSGSWILLPDLDLAKPESGLPLPLRDAARVSLAASLRSVVWNT
jgi:hypothetical protein